jgi:bifunctional DNase/RNase
MLRRAACLLLLALGTACADGASSPEDEISVRVGSVGLDGRNSPVVILEEENGSRVLPIWIGAAEATSIASQIHDRPLPRPNFHDLAQRVIQHLDAEVARVVVTELRGGTYYALLSLRADDRVIEIDVRPSDGIAVALRAQAPILVRASVFDEAGEPHPSENPGRSIDAPHAPHRKEITPATPALSL